MKLKSKTSAFALSISAAAILATAAIAQNNNAPETETNDDIKPDTKGECHGVNNCKGQTACATAEGSCAGTNSCAGKGWLLKTKAECDDLEGTFKPFEKKQ